MKKLSLMFLALLVLVFGCGSTTGEKSPSGAVKGYDFELSSVDGGKVRLSDFKGKVVVLQFFGTYCPPCRMEIPVLEKLYRDYGGKVVVVGVSVDYVGRDSSSLRSFVKNMGITYPVVVSDMKTWREYAGRITGFNTIPQTFILDREGFVRYYEVGFKPSYERLFRNAIDELLREG